MVFRGLNPLAGMVGREGTQPESGGSFLDPWEEQQCGEVGGISLEVFHPFQLVYPSRTFRFRVEFPSGNFIYPQISHLKLSQSPAGTIGTENPGQSSKGFLETPLFPFAAKRAWKTPLEGSGRNSNIPPTIPQEACPK